MASRKELLSAARCSAAAAEAAASAEAAVGAKGSGADAFLEAMWAMDGALGDQSPRLDKKRERAALDRARAGYREQLAVETAPAAVLHLSVLLLEAREYVCHYYCYYSYFRGWCSSACCSSRRILLVPTTTTPITRVFLFPLSAN